MMKLDDIVPIQLPKLLYYIHYFYFLKIYFLKIDIFYILLSALAVTTDPITSVRFALKALEFKEGELTRTLAARLLNKVKDQITHDVGVHIVSIFLARLFYKNRRGIVTTCSASSSASG